MPASPPSWPRHPPPRPKIADYPFTTLHPQLGVVRLNATEEFVLADIPGLIEGAHEGAGLGDRFLGHVERCAVLLHLIDGSQADPAGAWRTVRAELAGYGGGLADKPEIVALNKLDAMTPQARASRIKALARAVAGRCCCCPARPGRACRRRCARWPTRSRPSAPADAGPYRLLDPPVTSRPAGGAGVGQPQFTQPKVVGSANLPPRGGGAAPAPDHLAASRPAARRKISSISNV